MRNLRQALFGFGSVSPTKEQVEAVVEAGFLAIQIHGKMRGFVLLRPVGFQFFKAFNVSDMDAFSHYEGMDEVAGFVMDAAVPGSGKQTGICCRRLPSTEKQVFLAGGLNPDNVGEAWTACAGKIDGVDTSSGRAHRW